MSLSIDKLRMLTDHYRDTFEIIRKNLRKRDRLFIGVFILLILMLFQLYTPKDAATVLSQFIKNQLSIDATIDLLFIHSIIWFALLATTIRYCQAVILAERLYDYIHQLENLVSVEFDGKAFTREGKSYLKNYPAFLNLTSVLYTILFPLIHITICFSTIVNDFHVQGIGTALTWFNLAMFIFNLISFILYLCALHGGSTGERNTDD